MPDLEWNDINAFVAAYREREGASPNETLYRIIANQALAEMSEKGEIEDDTLWTDTASTGEITIVSNAVSLPSDVINVRLVEWNGNELDFIQLDILDSLDYKWRTTTGTPTKWTRRGRQILLDRIPSSPNTGLLKMYGTGCLPQFSKSGIVNPLARIPRAYQLLPAYKIIAMLPMIPAVPASDNPLVISDARIETQRRLSVREEFKAMYDAELKAFADATKARAQEPYTF